MKKVTFTTGLLGSGKTSFLDHFISERRPEHLHVIENEVGKSTLNENDDSTQVNQASPSH